MSFSVTQDFKTVEELADDLPGILAQVHKTGRPVVVTAKGKPNVVIVDATTYEKQLRLRNLAEMIAEAEADRLAGRTQSLQEVEAELRQS